MKKIVVITGASSGIGEKTGLLFKEKGFEVINISLTNSPHFKTYIADISDKNALIGVFNEIKEIYNKIDILINNAGYGMSGITELLDQQPCKKMFDVNFFGLLSVTQLSLPLMSKGGKIINISSAMALFPVPFRSMYGASKSAVLSLSYTLRMELKPCEIDVCAICPGNVRSNFTKNRVKNFETNLRYGHRIETATNKIDKNDSKRMGPEKVAKTIFIQATKKKSKPMKIVGGKYKLLYFLTQITPKSWLLSLTERFMGGRK